nr:PREDICTED: uncharacterized protein LOC104144840 [Struthio camelus australis]
MANVLERLGAEWPGPRHVTLVAETYPSQHMVCKKNVPQVDTGTQTTPSIEMLLKQRRPLGKRKGKSKDGSCSQARCASQASCDRDSVPQAPRSTAPSLTNVASSGRPGAPMAITPHSRKSEVLCNLYTNVYDKVGEDQDEAVLEMEGLEVACHIPAKTEISEAPRSPLAIPAGLPRARFIFHAIRDGQIHVEDLPQVLQALGLPVSDAELRQALELVPVDAHGNLDFHGFLGALSQTTAAAATSEAFQPIYEAFGKMKQGSIAAADLQPVLLSLGIRLPPGTLQERLQNAQGEVNISNLVAALGDSEHHRKDTDECGPLTESGDAVSARQDPFKHVDGIKADNTEAAKLRSILQTTGIHPTEQEFEEALQKVAPETPENAVGAASAFESDQLATSDLVACTNQLGIQEGLEKASADTMQEALEILSKVKNNQMEVSQLGEVLANMGIVLPEEELREALSRVPVTGDEKVNFKAFMKSLTSTRRLSETARDEVDIQNLDSILGTRGAPLTSKNLQEAFGHTTEDSVAVDNLGSVLATMGIRLTPEQLQEVLSRADGDKVSIQDLDSILGTMGIHLTSEELQEALGHTAGRAHGKVNLSEFMKAEKTVQKPPLGKEDKVDVSNVGSILATMGIHLTPEELQEAWKHVPVDEGGDVSLSAYLSMMNTRRPSQAERNRVDIRSLDTILGSVGIHLTNEEMQEVLEHVTVDSDGKVNLSEFMHQVKAIQSTAQGAAFRNAFNFFPKDPDGTINLHSLQETAKELGISLTSQEASNELVYADADRDGKVNFSDFLTIVTDNKCFMQAIVPEKNYTGNFDSKDARRILLFEILSKLVELAALPRRTLLEIVRYYQQKFMNCTGQKAWKDSDNSMYCKKRHHKIRKDQAYVSSFVSAARISVMNDKDLVAYVEGLKACVPLSDSPYAEVPIFPLIPKQDTIIAGRPKKDLQKLERQRRNEPIASSENFFHKRNWLQEMKRATQLYRQGLALHERARLLRLWRRIRGGQIALETGSERFHHIFSVYSWSWNTCQELVTPDDLRRVDNELYRRPRGSSTRASRAAARGQGIVHLIFYNRDNVEWSEEQEASARSKVQQNSSQLLPQDKQEEYEVNANRYWDDFYKIHENGFFKDRHWLFTEFPELAPNRNPSQNEVSGYKCSYEEESNSEGLGSCENGHSLGTRAENELNLIKSKPTFCTEESATQKHSELNQSDGDYPGSSATYRILEVGCGAGNTVFPILQTNNDPGLFVYCCDFSTIAVDLVQTNAEYDSSRCFAFVHDLCNDQSPFPMPEESLDIVILIFVLSAILPEKMQCIVNRLSRLLKPGGMILLRDYGRYDLAQLRFKKGQCLSDNFYVRGDGTRVYFFTQDELDDLFTTAGLEKIQNLVDRRLQVNRGKQMTMYRVWIQCKYRKPVASQL